MNPDRLERAHDRMVDALGSDSAAHSMVECLARRGVAARVAMGPARCGREGHTSTCVDVVTPQGVVTLRGECCA